MSNINKIEITSYKGKYSAEFTLKPFQIIEQLTNQNICLIIDKNVFNIYKNELENIISKTPYYVIEATEENKDLSKFTEYSLALTQLGVKRNCTLVAIGGGIIQDITCFIASTLFRGLNWVFFPTTLLAQSDSCIGSKSSINVGGTKNLMGTFYPPNQIYISLNFLKTLKQVDIYSGIGEMIKVHCIAGIKKIAELSENYDQMLKDDTVFQHFLYQSLLIKKDIIEKDEFDTGPRLVMNFGHTFGHAIESATNYSIPHGLAVTYGQSMACEYSQNNNFINSETNKIVQQVLKKNYQNTQKAKLQFDVFMRSILKDKKNSGQNVTLIIPKNDLLKIEKHEVEPNENFKTFCKNYFIAEGFDVC